MALIVSIAVVLTTVAAESMSVPVPSPGDIAPLIVASRWVKGEPVADYEPGRVYVVDLWSTWCKPCIDAFPVLKAIESKYGNEVTFIGLDIWEMDSDRVNAFLSSNLGVLPSTVALDSIPEGCDPFGGLCTVQFLGTSESASIPKTFIVDQSGRIAWIGLPEELEAPLEQVLAGKWVREANAKVDSSTENTSRGE